MGVFQTAWDAKKKAEQGLQYFGKKGIRPVFQVLGHIPFTFFDSSTLPKKKKP